MNHIFNVEIAKKYGILEAVIINHFQFWLKKNKANETNYHEGRYWTYNSISAFSKLLPYASEKQIRGALQRLQDENILMTGNFNKAPFDRTLWYSFTDFGKSILQNGNIDDSLLSNAFAPEGKSILPKSQMDLTPRANGFSSEGKPIPDINTDIITDDNTDNAKPSLVDLYQKLCPRLKPYSENQLKPDLTGIAKEIQMNGMDIEEVFKTANESDFLAGVGGGWQADFRWLMVVGNAKKVLAGNYQNKELKKKPSFDQRTYDYDALERAMMKKRDERLKGD